MMNVKMTPRGRPVDDEMANSSSQSGAGEVKRFHLTLRSLFWLQLVLAPAFLSPLYYRIYSMRLLPSHGGSYFLLLTMLVAPIFYSAIFTIWSERSVSREKWGVFARIRVGVLYAILFNLLALGPLVVLGLVENAPGIWKLVSDFRFPAVRESPHDHIVMILQKLPGSNLLPIALVYVLLGAVAGGVIGLVRDLLRRRGSSESN